jgi:membrane-associated protein
MDIFTGEKLIELIKWAGYFGLFGIIFAESGLLIGFFLPGDSLLFTAGVLASQGFLNIYILLPTIIIAAIAGDSAGYLFGRKVGRKIFNREDSVIFHKNNLLKAQSFYDKYGPMTIIIARFVPVVRTFAPIVAGVGEMDYKKFVSYNIIGGLLWTLSMTLGGFYLIKIFPSLEHNLELVVIAIIILSVIPAIYHYLKEKADSKKHKA